MPDRNKNAFTLIELLVVISIIGLLASIILVATVSAREKARVAVAVADLKQVATAAKEYRDDTGVYPPTCDHTCTIISDPFLNSLGVAGWNGPYMTLWSVKDPWGGHLGFFNESGSIWVDLDDDAPGKSGSDNSGLVPDSSQLQIDNLMDDGNLNTGIIQTGTSPACNGTVGEICYFLPQ